MHPATISHTGRNRYSQAQTLPSADTMVTRIRRLQFLSQQIPTDQIYTPQAYILCHE